MMKTLILILAPALWLAYSVLEGTREGYLYAYRDSDDPGYLKNLHPMFTMQRSIMVIALLLAMLVISAWYFLPIAALSWMMIFPLIHDGFYYMTRNDLDRSLYPDRFLSNDNTSTAKISFESFFRRIYLAMGACVVYGIFVWLTIR